MTVNIVMYQIDNAILTCNDSGQRLMDGHSLSEDIKHNQLHCPYTNQTFITTCASWCGENMLTISLLLYTHVNLLWFL